MRRRLSIVLALVLAGAVVDLGGPAAMAETSDVNVQVEPTLNFEVTGRTLACNGVLPTSGATSSGNSLNLGSINNVGVASQSLNVSTNAASGWTVYARSLGPMNSPNGHTLAAVASSNAAPGPFPVIGTESIGYTLNDSTLSGPSPNRFTAGGPNWAAMDAANAEVYFNDNAFVGGIRCVAYRAQAGPTTPAGTYSTTVVYTAVPLY